MLGQWRSLRLHAFPGVISEKLLVQLQQHFCFALAGQVASGAVRLDGPLILFFADIRARQVYGEGRCWPYRAPAYQACGKKVKGGLH